MSTALNQRRIDRDISCKSWRGDPNTIRSFQIELLKWFGVHRRDLPWRENREPYRVWVSEIMLQQTRVAAVIVHYRKFLERFPTLPELAAASEASVLAAWSGLGYYRRARMLHAAAKMVVRNHEGEIPTNREALKELPGIGRYTSAAIASIAYGQQVAVVDGNVRRVLERIIGRVGNERQIWQLAENLISADQPGDSNQALMELGALVCVPKVPACLRCPVRDFCATRGSLNPQSPPSKQQKRRVTYNLAHRNGSVYLVQRPKRGRLMPGMWELPEAIGPVRQKDISYRLRHSITVTDFEVGVVQASAPRGGRGKWVKEGRLLDLPLTGLARKIMRGRDHIMSAAENCCEMV